MPEIQSIWEQNRKYLLNIIYFIISTVIVVAVWPKQADGGFLRTLGITILVSSCYLVLYLFLSHFRSEVLYVTRKTLFIILTILSFVLLTRFVIAVASQKILFLIPIVIIPVVIRTFYDARLALFILLIAIMLSGFMIPDPFVFIFMNFIAGMAAIYSLSNIYRKGKFFYYLHYGCYKLLCSLSWFEPDARREF